LIKSLIGVAVDTRSQFFFIQFRFLILFTSVSTREYPKHDCVEILPPLM
jgi:hypothetical protein